MAAILQMIFSDALSWMKSFAFWLELKFVPTGPIKKQNQQWFR